jgi:hypothetical protein
MSEHIHEPRARRRDHLDRDARSRSARAWGRPRSTPIALLAALLTSCTGGLVEGPSGPGSPEQQEDSAKAFAAAPAALRKLTMTQYRNTARDLLGAHVTLPAELEEDTAINGFFAIGAAKATISPLGSERYEAAAYALAAQALDAAHRDAFVGCTPSDSSDTRCTRDFLTRFGLRAFRRPLTSEELDRYAALAKHAQTTLADFYAGLEFAVAGLLQSPNFLFRVELGNPDPEAPARRKFDDYEMASRLAYLLWNSTPDPELLEAAARGELVTIAGLREQTERLLADDRARAALDVFHSEWLALDELATLDKDAALYAGMDDALRGAMRDDVLDTIEALTFGSELDFRALFTTRVAFVTPALAALYGLDDFTGGRRVELPASAQRAGLLGKAAFLAMNAHQSATSPTKRGKYIRERFLCQSIAAPPPNVVTVLPETNPDAPTMRDRLAPHAEQPSCAGCHELMDPLGLSLEHFDAIGRYRADDDGHPLDTTGALDGAEFDGAEELAQLLHDHPATSACVARQLYRYAVAHVETSGEAPAVEALERTFAQSGHRFLDLLRAVVESDGFRYAAGE